jgi:hypothetical protein
VSIDLVALGVPVIELLDVRALPEHDTPDAARDDEGRLRFGPYRRDKLVIPADDIRDLRSAFAQIAAERETIIVTLQSAAKERFARPSDVSIFLTQ